MLHKKMLNTDGSLKGVTEYTESTDPQDMINIATQNSQDYPYYYVIIGDNLESDPTIQSAKVVVAPQGILIFQNVLN